MSLLIIKLIKMSFKNTVIFIHGLFKNADQWNITEYGKYIGIIDEMKKTSNVINLTWNIITHDDYINNDELYFERIINEVPKNSTCIVIAHSFGSFYALKLYQLNKLLIKGIILLDPVVLNEKYIEKITNELKSLDEELVKTRESNLKLINSIKSTTVDNKVIIKIHVRSGEDLMERFSDNLDYYHNLTKLNVKSQIIFHPNTSHMIFYDKPANILHSIKTLIKE